MSFGPERAVRIESTKDNINKSSSAFNPDKRIGSSFNTERNFRGEGKPEQNGKWDTQTQRNEGTFDPDKRIEKAHYTTYEERIENTPTSERGTWTGERGESKFIPKNAEMKQQLEKYGINGIEYKNGIPDFSPVAKTTVKIDNMTADRQGNFQQADGQCAKKWNASNFEGKSNWTPREVKDWRRENHYSWHERSDRKNCDLVPQNIHQEFTHTGGVAECKRRDGNIAGQNGSIKGGGFDA